MDNDMRPQHDGSDSFLHPGEEHHYASGNLKTQPPYPGEEHYYDSGKLKTQPSFYRRHAWQISTAVLAVMVMLLSLNTLRTAKQSATSHARPASISPTLVKPKPVFNVGSTWQGTFYQDYVGNYQTPMILRVDNLQGTTFSGTMTESMFANAVTTTKGHIVDNINSLEYLDKQRLQEVINMYGNAGTLIIYTNPYQLNGDSVILNSRLYALVSQDGILRGIDFNPSHDPRNLRPDGNFTLYKEG
ncbi:MAG TPA: hypothetical protein VN207_12020 [Ktedonobacteraceae bacterium]|nr:hypothetical protein [Ktedonobacteraceae bacterium]